MSIMIPSYNAHAYMKFSKKNFAPYAKNATVKNILAITKYNVGMKSRAYGRAGIRNPEPEPEPETETETETEPEPEPEPKK